MITSELIKKGMSYEAYKRLVADKFNEGKTTGINTEEYLNFSRINLYRMDRLDKTIVLEEKLVLALSNVKDACYLIAISEGWCGDAAQNIPVFAKISAISTFDLRILLRDENPSVMDQYLTSGARSIPKIIAVRKKDLKQIFVWGPRPAALQALVGEMLARGISKAEKGILVQGWYNSDKTKTIQSELLELVRNL
jgi:hypothetical protein